nr:hypothetical protein [Bacillus sp. FJAT-29790]
MLPEHYCDYLLALYTEGEQPPQEIRKKTKGNKIRMIQFLFLMIIPLIVYLIHFTELSISLQMAFSILSIFAGICFTFYFSRKGILLQIPLISSALILLLSSVEFISRAYPERQEILYFILIINSILWLLTGWKLKLPSFIISGLLGLVLIIIFIFT